MSRKQYALLVVVAVCAGLVGGVASNRFFTPRWAYAEEQAKVPKVIEAQEFRVVDDEGHLRATLGIEYEDEYVALMAEFGAALGDASEEEVKAIVDVIRAEVGGIWVDLSDDELTEAIYMMLRDELEGRGDPVRLVLYDEGGETWVYIEASQRFGGNVQLNGDNGAGVLLSATPHVEFEGDEVLQSVGYLMLSSEDKSISLAFGADPGGPPMIDMSKSTARVEAGESPCEYLSMTPTSLRLYGNEGDVEDGAPYVSLKADGWGGVFLTHKDKDPNAVGAQIAVNDDGGYVSVTGPAGRVRAASQGPRVTLYNDEGMARAILGTSQTKTGVVEEQPLSSLLLFDEEGKLLWNAP